MFQQFCKIIIMTEFQVVKSTVLQLNLDYLDFSIIRTIASGPNLFMNINLAKISCKDDDLWVDSPSIKKAEKCKVRCISLIVCMKLAVFRDEVHATLGSNR